MKYLKMGIRCLLAALLVLAPTVFSTSTAQVLVCRETIERCAQWIPIQIEGVETVQFIRDGVPIKAGDIREGDLLVSTTPASVHRAPADGVDQLFELGKDTSVLVEEIRFLSSNRSGPQIWIKIKAPPEPQQQLYQSLSFNLSAEERAKLLEGRDIFFDGDGLIVHRDADGKWNGGDTAQREGWYWLGVWLRQNTTGVSPWQPTRSLTFDQVLSLLEPQKDGIFYRHPKQPPFNNPFDKEWGFSRDQLIPLVAAMGVWGKTEEIRRLWNALPEDLIGKHSFNGDWRNFLGQPGPNCGDINKRGCDAPMCERKEDKRSCPSNEDRRPCPLNEDKRDCSANHDTRSCGHDVDWGLLGRHHVNDPKCEAEKAAQNKIYEAGKIACEVAKATQNSAYAAGKAACEAGKEAQNRIYSAIKAECDAERTAQNAAYWSEFTVCLTLNASKKAACEFDKAVSYQACRFSNVHSGDPIGPATVNLFRRAIGHDPLAPSPDNPLPGTALINGSVGEAELFANSFLRVEKTQRDLDDVGDDLNHIVMLIMARLRYPTATSDAATSLYAAKRPHSYGSYLGQYYRVWGDDMHDVQQRIEAGIAHSWAPDVNAPYGAVRWYHRPSSGANPALALLYREVIEHYIK